MELHINDPDSDKIISEWMYNELIKKGKEEYKDLLETLYLSSIPGMKEKIVKGLNTPLDECVPEDEVEW